MSRITIAIALLMLFAATLVQAQPRMSRTTIPLNSGWKFQEVGKTDWHPATVPGCVHTDLLNNKLIDDPFYRDNEKKLQWIGNTDWEYETAFDASASLLSREHVELVFAGLDTYANVSLNGTQLLAADNMFRTWRVECKSALKPGRNILHIRFRSPINEVLPLMAQLNYQLPSPNDQGEKTAPFTRKAPYHFGWDWGPRFVTSGIWKPVSIEAWDRARIDDLHIKQRKITPSEAKLSAELEVDATADLNATITLMSSLKTVVASQEVHVNQGTNRINLDFDIPHPKLWWPNGLGNHYLYDFKAQLLLNGRKLDEANTRTGLRSLELRQEPDQWGKSFLFIINGMPVFAKGGNWIPADNFPSRISREKYRWLLESVRDANMNMLRVWGGGIYESNDFYDLCDQMGILIWQDFMFAGSMYPGNAEFLDNVRHEAIDNVKRLRNHPSVVLYAGNNEIEAGWANWGWRQKLPASLWDDYKKIFLGVLPEVCASYDPDRPYWPSSPHSEIPDDVDSARSGDMHFWRVWHFAEPFNNYEQQQPRFMSEYGFQSFPQIDTVDSYTVASDRDIQSAVMLAHQRHPRGNQLIREYMLRDYPEPKDFESFLYVSQVLQAEGIKVGAEHLRRIMPRNMGSLYWQIDDCWPVASWSSIDYYGRWKALQYYARRFYNDLLISGRLENGNIDLYVVSDRTQPVPAEIRLRLMDFEGNVLTSTNKNVVVEPQSSKAHLNLSTRELLEGRDPKKLMLSAQLVVGKEVVSANEYFFDSFKNLAIPVPKIATDVTAAGKNFKVTVSSDKLARAVYLSVQDSEGFFSDNYFNLLPGGTVTVEYRSRTPLSVAELRRRLRVRSLADAF